MCLSTFSPVVILLAATLYPFTKGSGSVIAMVSADTVIRYVCSIFFYLSSLSRGSVARCRRLKVVFVMLTFNHSLITL